MRGHGHVGRGEELVDVGCHQNDLQLQLLLRLREKERERERGASRGISAKWGRT